MRIYLIKLPSKKDGRKVSTRSRVLRHTSTDKQSIILPYKALASRSLLASGVLCPSANLPSSPSAHVQWNELPSLLNRWTSWTDTPKTKLTLYDARVLVSNFYVEGGVGLTFVLMNHVNSSLCHLTIGFTQHFWLQKRELSLSPENSSRITLLPQVHQGLEEKFRESQVQIL